MADIFHWEGILDSNMLADKYQGTIAKIMEGNYHGLNLEKLAGHNVFSVRINQSDRLLFTVITINNKRYLLLLDEVINHKYQNSRFLKPKVLRNYLELNGESLSKKVINDQLFKPHAELDPLSSNNDEAYNYKHIDYFNQKFIRMNEAQKAVTNTALPMIISGAPGSGKSSVALSLMTKWVGSKQKGPFLYVCKSRNLADNIANSWESLPIAQGLPDDLVKICCYEDLIADLDEDSENTNQESKKPVEKDAFFTWLKEYSTRYLNLVKALGKTALDTKYPDNADKDLIYQEFRIISGMDSEATYLQRGEKQSLFKEQAQRKWLYKAYTVYLEKLKNSNEIHLPFYSPKATGVFERVVVDESQDLSVLQLKSLAHLAIDGQIAYCEDNSQNLDDNKAKTPFIRETLAALSNKVNEINLPFSYRCPAKFVEMANALNDAKYKLTKNKVPPISSNPELQNSGTLEWTTDLDAMVAKFRKDPPSADFAIITQENNKEELKKLFNTQLVYTPEEIKGLEFKNILIYNLLNQDIFYDANNELDKLEKNPALQSKRQEGQDKFAPAFSGVYTALTRATESLYICQDKNHKLRHITGSLEAVCKQAAQTNSSSSSSTTSNTSTSSSQAATDKDNQAAWFDLVKAHLVRGDIARAKEIYIKDCKKTEAEFNVLREDFSLPTPKRKTKKEAKAPTATAQKAVASSASSTSSTSSSSSSSSSSSTTATKAQSKAQAKTKTTDTKTHTAKVVPFLAETFINGMTNLATPDNLLYLVNHPDAMELIFDKMPVQQISLFANVLNTSRSRPIFIRVFLEHVNKFAHRITSQLLCEVPPKSATVTTSASPLFWLATDPKGRELLHKLYSLNPGAFKNITAEDFGKPLANFGADTNTTALYWMLANPDGRLIFSNWLVKDPSLAMQVDAKTLLRKRFTHNGKPKHTSILQLLADDETGQHILKALLNLNETLAPALSAAVFSEPVGENGPSLLCILLSCSTLGQNIFKMILEKNKDVGENLDPNVLLKRGNDDISSMYWLTSTLAGHQCLAKLLELQPSLLTKITAEHLFFRPAVLQTVCCFFGLSSTTTGTAILKKIITANPGICKNISARDISLARPDNIGYTSNTSILSNLCEKEDRVGLLQMICAENPDLIKGFTAADFTRCRAKEADVWANTSPLSNLAVTVAGATFLEYFIDNNPEAAKQITAADLIKPCLRGRITDGVSTLYWLSTTDRGQRILSKLLALNPKLAKEISPLDVVKVRTEEAGPETNTSVLYMLAGTEEGCKILNTFTRENPDFIRGIKAKDLTKLRPPILAQGEMISSSPYYWLQRSVAGWAFLLAVIEKATQAELEEAGLHKVETNQIPGLKFFNPADPQQERMTLAPGLWTARPFT